MKIDLTPREIGFACALPIEGQPLAVIRRQANANGHDIQKVRPQRLVEAGIAEWHVTVSGERLLSRGPQWHEFFKTHGIRDTERCLRVQEVRQIVRDLFLPLNSNVVQFPRP